MTAAQCQPAPNYADAQLHEASASWCSVAPHEQTPEPQSHTMTYMELQSEKMEKGKCNAWRSRATKWKHGNSHPADSTKLLLTGSITGPMEWNFIQFNAPSPLS